MAYVHGMHEVYLIPLQHAPTAVSFLGAGAGGIQYYGFSATTPTGTTPSIGGVAYWEAGIIPHKVHAVAIMTHNDLATQVAAVSTMPRFKWHQCVTHGSVTVFTASDVFMVMSLPTTVTGGAMFQTKTIINYVTANVIIKPGNGVKLTMDSNIEGSYAAKMLISPVWEQSANVTSAFVGPGAS